MLGMFAAGFCGCTCVVMLQRGDYELALITGTLAMFNFVYALAYRE